jgi:hypothetical protein
MEWPADRAAGCHPLWVQQYAAYEIKSPIAGSQCTSDGGLGDRERWVRRRSGLDTSVLGGVLIAACS